MFAIWIGEGSVDVHADVDLGLAESGGYGEGFRYRDEC